MVYQLSAVAHQIPAFLQRIRGEEAVQHEFVHPSFSVSTKVADVFSFCRVDYQGNFKDFYQRAINKIEQMQSNPVFEDEEGRDDFLYLSAVPWVSFTSISHAMHYHPHDSIPRISWGKYFKDGDKTLMPLSLTAHHALVDGRNMGEYFNLFEEKLFF